MLNWASRFLDAGAGGIWRGAAICPRPSDAAMTYCWCQADRRYSPAQSRPGSASNDWKTSAQPGLPKCFSPSCGGPK